MVFILQLVHRGPHQEGQASEGRPGHSQGEGRVLC